MASGGVNAVNARRPPSQNLSVNSLCRLSFNPEIADSITLEKLPYHYCAVTGNVNLAAFLYVQKVPFSKGITIANFAADGKDGSTPWKKPVMLSPLDIANMAGKQADSHHDLVHVLLCAASSHP